jgi:hypothetical protein
MPEPARPELEHLKSNTDICCAPAGSECWSCYDMGRVVDYALALERRAARAEAIVRRLLGDYYGALAINEAEQGRSSSG